MKLERLSVIRATQIFIYWHWCNPFLFLLEKSSKLLVIANTLFNGTLGVISSDPPCTDGNVRFTTVPFKGVVWSSMI